VRLCEQMVKWSWSSTSGWVRGSRGEADCADWAKAGVVMQAAMRHDVRIRIDHMLEDKY
jgi:hypothetical protein